jgi:hypothetical protein
MLFHEESHVDQSMCTFLCIIVYIEFCVRKYIIDDVIAEYVEMSHVSFL